ncbi:hypothetical protein F3K36_02470, partial [Delftia sp. BR1]
PACSTWPGRWCWAGPRARTTWCSAPCSLAACRAGRARTARWACSSTRCRCAYSWAAAACRNACARRMNC